MFLSPRRSAIAGTALAIALTITIPPPAVGAQTRAKSLNLQDEILKQATWRSIGPAVMGGRIADIACDAKDPYTFYVALATGGLIKTTNDGLTWTPVFDHETVASIGAVAIAPSEPKTVWVGSGEANGRNSSSWGDGVYKSTDAGATWTNMGLKDTQEIGRIAIDPTDPNIVFVAAAGHLWGPNPERGVFRTTDGGKTWQKTLYVDDSTGAIDVALGAPGGNVVYAATYARRRYPWGFDGVGAGSAIYKSTNDGRTWSRLTNGLPTGPLGRIGLSVCRDKPDVVFAVIENQQGGSGNLFGSQSRHGGVFRSDDAGDTWTRVSGTAPRGFYFGQIRVDPTTPDRVYVLGFDLAVSDDGGKTFRMNGSPGVHSDLHALWIDPDRPDRMLLGTDGGLYSTYDRGKAWDHVNNFPEGEFYEVTTDDQTPFWVYGGLQDNDCWLGPSAEHEDMGPSNTDWLTLGTGGDGFYTFPDPADPNIVYGESQNGDAVRWDRTTNRRKSLHPHPSEGQPDYRFNWNTAFTVSHFDHTTLYMGGNRLFRFTAGGKEWDAISPDLSKQEGPHITSAGSGAEAYGTIISIAESPIRKGVIWCGTDDGNIQVTQDDGATWTNVTDHLPAAVRSFWVTRVLASRVSASRAYAAIDGHRSNEFQPHLFVTEDYGKTWKSISSHLPALGPVQAICEDPYNPSLLFAGTEFGAFASFDRGSNWMKLDKGLPTVAVDDLAIQQRDHSLVAATHGRSLYVVDNIAPLEDLTPAVRESDIHLFPIPPGEEFLPGPGEWFPGPRDYHGQNKPSGVEIVYWLKNLADAAPRVRITDAGGKVVATLTGQRYPGLARLRWDMRVAQPNAPPRQFGGPEQQPRFVKPGLYTATLTVGSFKQSQSVIVSGPAALSVAPADADQEDAPGR